MKFAIVIFKASAVAASIFDTILPTTEPTVTSDPWRCTTEIFERFFDPPKPTGQLLTALLSYGDELIKDCTATKTNVVGIPTCPFPAQEEWCAFTTAAPTALLPDYSSYASTASSWWSVHSAQALEHARYCPSRWFRAMTRVPAGAGWLNDTIAFAGCYASANGHTTKPTTTNTVSATSMASQRTGKVSIETSKPNDSSSRTNDAKFRFIAGTVLAVALTSALV